MLTDFLLIRTSFRWDPEFMDAYGNLVRPELARVLKLLKMDITYTSALADSMYYQKENQQIKVYDFLGGYGSTILGHNHKIPIEALQDCIANKIPQHAQASIRRESADLAEMLNQMLKEQHGEPRNFIMTLANSGSEAVEIALKHALLQWQNKKSHFAFQIESQLHRQKELPHEIKTFILQKIEQLKSLQPLIVHFENSYHGKTAASIQVTANSYYSRMFQNSLFQTKAISTATVFSELQPELESAIWRLMVPGQEELTFSPMAGVIFEPIQGEGGINEIPFQLMRPLQAWMKSRNIPLIADEIQSGVYRTGDFLASTHQQLQPDYILLGKSLGGGLQKISACLIAEDHYQDEIGWIQSSTNAEDAWSSTVALKTLQYLSEHRYDIAARARKFNDRITETIQRIQQQYPGVIAQKKGRGFFLGLEFRFDRDAKIPAMIQGIYEQGHASYFYTSFLLHKHQIRVGVTLSAPNTIRIEPSAYVTDEAIGALDIALWSLSKIIFERRILQLTEALWDQEFTQSQLATESEIQTAPVPRTKERREIGFLTHPPSLELARNLDLSLKHVELAKLEKFFDLYRNQAAPFRYHQQIIKGLNGTEIVLNLYGLMQPSSYFENQLRRGLSSAAEKVQAAVDLARADGMNYFGLGQFTSIVSENGLLLRSENLALTTGNSLTAGMAALAMLKLAQQKFSNLSQVRLGVVGFTGNICQTLTEILADWIPHLTLIHREKISGSPKFQKAVQKLVQNSKAQIEKLKFSNSVADLKDCELIVVGTNSAKEFILSEHIQQDSIILDISVPTNVHVDVRSRKDVTYIQGGLAKLPFEQKINHPFAPDIGQNCFACLAETITMGLLGRENSYSLGGLNKAQVLESLELAAEVGIELGALRAEVTAPKEDLVLTV